MVRRWLSVRKGLLRAILPILRVLPLPVASRMIARIGRTEYALLGRLRAAYDAAVARGGDQLGCAWDIPAVSRDLAGNQVRWRTRDLLLDGVPDHRAAPMFLVTGREYLDEALALGKGVILLGSHYGAHLLPSHWLVREGYPLRYYMERPRHVSKFLSRHFETDGPLGQSKLFISRKGDPAGSASSILRASYDAAVSRGGHQLGCEWDVPAVSRDLAGNPVRWRTRDLLLDGVPDHRAAPMFVVTGREHLDEALGLRKGVILLGSHYGAHLLPSHWLVREGYPVRY